MPGQVEFKPGQIVYHAESDRYATVIEAKTYYSRIQGRFGKASGTSRHVYPSRTLGLNVYAAIIDEANFMGNRKPPTPPTTLISIKWLDDRWSDATWDATHFVVRHPLEALAECAD